MPLSIDTDNSYTLFLGTSGSIKDSSIITPENIAANLIELAAILKNKQLVGIPESSIVQLLDEKDNIKIKEHIAAGSEASNSAFILYYTGHILLKKNALYLATPISTKQYIQVNGISLTHIADILKDAPAATKLLIFDAYFSSEEDSQEDKQIVNSFLQKMSCEIEGMHFISTSPQINGSAAQDKVNPAYFTKILVKIMQTGIKNNKDAITLKELYEAVNKELKQAGNQSDILISNRSLNIDFNVAHNSLHINFNKLIEKAEIAFKKHNFKRALTFYKEAQVLYDTQDIQKKLTFLNFLLKAEQYFDKCIFAKAKIFYEKAQRVIALDLVKEKLCICMEYIAKDLLEHSRYDQAKIIYQNLATLKPDDKNYEHQIITCDRQINYNSLVDRGDACYFKDDYAKARGYYLEALNIYRDSRVVQRKNTCELFIAKEEAIRENLTVKLRKQIESEYTHKEAHQQKATVNEAMQKELTEKIKREQAKVFENTFWNRASLWNTLEGYQFYLDFYPAGMYVAKVNKRIEQLKQKHKANKVVAQSTTTKDTSEHIFAPAKNITDELSKSASALQVGTSQGRLPTSENTETLPEQKNINETGLSPENISTKIPQVDKNKTMLIQTANESKPIVSEEEMWRIAQEKNTVEAYKSYLDNTEESKYVIDAFYMINKLKNQHTLAGESGINDPKTNVEVSAESNSKTTAAYDYIPAVEQELNQKT